MSARLRPLREDELPAFIARGREGYARDLVAQAGFKREAADTKTEEDWSKLFPDGAILPGHHLFAVEDADSNEVVGALWWAERDGEEGKIAFVYEIEIAENARGRGFGRDAMTLLEDDVRANGLSRISLNVFGGNDVARSLYRKLDYTERAVFMSKTL